VSRARKPGRADIAKDGRRETVRRQVESVAAVRRAMREIERDIAKNDGIYPENKGRLTLQELLRRAKKSAAYLEKKSPAIVALKQEVREWLGTVNGKAITGAKNIRRKVTARVEVVTDEVKAIRQRWTEAELEYVHTSRLLDKANEDLDRLKKENAVLLTQIAGRKVSTLRK
jgi:hypothetical protein